MVVATMVCLVVNRRLVHAVRAVKAVVMVVVAGT